MAGITRIIITDDVRGAGAYRFRDAMARQPAANELYRKIFKETGCELHLGENEIQCTKNDIHAAYDRLLGIDVILTLQNGMQCTLQEKFLFTKYNTVTVEYYNNPVTKDKGDWFDLKANYYFVGYDRIKANSFQDWIMLDWASIQMCTSRGEIPWGVRDNQYDGAKANFKFVNIGGIPNECVLAKDWGNGSGKVDRLNTRKLLANKIEQRPFDFILSQSDIFDMQKRMADDSHYID